MTIKRRLICEMRSLLASPIKLLVPCAAALVLGILTWISCRGLGLIWRHSAHPSLSLPLPVFIFAWCIIYLLMGVLFTLASQDGSCPSLSLKMLVAYLSLLFWCPLLMIAGNLLCSLAALVLSVSYLTSVIKVLGKFSLLAVFCFGAVLLFLIYMGYFTVIFAMIN